MTARDDDVPPGQSLSAAINAIEGYLLAEREKALARAEAERFADRLPWLLTAQRHEVVHHYTLARTASSQRQLQAVAERCGELRDEYEQRYRLLRLRLLRTCAALLAAAVPVCALVSYTTAHCG